MGSHGTHGIPKGWLQGAPGGRRMLLPPLPCPVTGPVPAIRGKSANKNFVKFKLSKDGLFLNF